MRVLITGAAGFIGTHLAHRLAGLGHHVYAFDNLSHGRAERLLERDVAWFNEDIRDTVSLGFSPDVVYHLAAISNLAECQSDPAEAYSVNVAGTANLLELSRRAGVKRFVFVSSSAVLENPGAPPDLIYSMTKAAGEALCRTYAHTYGMEILVARPENCYGSGQDPTRRTPCLIPYLIRSLLEGQSPTLYGSGDQKRDWVYIEDVVDALELLLDQPVRTSGFPTSLYQIGTGQPASLLFLYQTLQQLTGLGGKVPLLKWGGSMWDVYTELHTGCYPMQKARIDQEALKSVDNPAWMRPKGWEPKVTLEEGLRRTVAFYRQEWGL